MNDLGIIDQFLQTFSTYIDSGFGLLAPDVAFLTTALVTIDIVLAGLFWAFGNLDNIVVGFLKKVLYIGFFALLLNQFPLLANIIFESFAQLGLNATGGTITAADLLRPGFVASTGFTAAHPLLDEIADLSGPVAFFVNIVTIAILALAWLITLFAFFFLAIQIFVTIIEFKLTTLAGFVLVPFALWNKTSFLAERVLGNVISSGIKLMVLAIIVGIGSTLFGNVTSGFTPGNITLQDAAAVILASLALLALGIFGPGIATGLVSGAPQLGAGAAVGTAVGAGAAGFAGASVGGAAASAATRGAVGAVKAGSSMAGGTAMSYSMGKAASGQGGIKGAASGMAAVAHAGAGSVANAAKSAAAKVTDPVKQSFKSGSRGAITATGGKISGGESGSTGGSSTNGQPDWAKKANRNQLQRDAGLAATSALRDGDRGGSGDGPRLKQDEE
ncbi:P-type conjugative transfer protein TrbL [Parasphingorhabdus sp. DH2-15]|uniref:P-type conjugative transfer protein TrbL n=1 Tax=Parasphingorhabdus sp. DH2-15 TaxID=3444112 RepID=UPI003F6824D4